MLIAKGIISDEQLEEALREQQVTAERLGTILVSRGYVDEVDLVRILAEHFGLEFIDLEERPIDPSAVQLVKESFARYHQLLPVGYEDDRLLVAMVNPTNVFSLDDLRSVTGEDIRALMAEPNQLMRAIDRVWGAADTDEAILRIEQDQVDEEDITLSASAVAAPMLRSSSRSVSCSMRRMASSVSAAPHTRSMARISWPGSAMIARTSWPVTERTSSSENTLVGLTMATSSWPSSRPIGSSWW